MPMSLAVLDSLRAQWDQAIGSYQIAKANLDSAESQLYSWQLYASQDPQDWAEWQAQFSKVNAAKSMIDSLESAVATVQSWWNSATGVFGLSGARMRRNGIAATAGLGFGPLIPAMTVGAFLAIVASIGAIVTGIGSFITYLMLKKDGMEQLALRTQQIMDADPNKTIDQASELARKEIKDTAQTESDHSWLTGLQRTLTLVVLGLAAVFIVPKLIEMKHDK